MVNHFQKQIFFGNAEQIIRNTSYRKRILPEFFKLKSNSCKAIHVLSEQLRLLHRQVQNDRRADHLGCEFPVFHFPQCPFIQNSFMCCMLVDNIQTIFELDKPVGIENLPNQRIICFSFFVKKTIFKEIHLFRFFICFDVNTLFICCCLFSRCFSSSRYFWCYICLFRKLLFFRIPCSRFVLRHRFSYPVCLPFRLKNI